MQHITQHDRLVPRYGTILMDLKCDQCGEKNKGRYSTFFFGKKLATMCNECRWGIGIKGSADKDKKTWEHISTPLWVHAGQKPNAEERAQVAYMKKHNMSWGDLRKERDAKLARSPGAMKRYQEYMNKEGKK